MDNTEQVYSTGREVLETVLGPKLLEPWLQWYTGRIWTKYVPNAITFARLPMTIGFFAVYGYGWLNQDLYWQQIGTVLLAATAISDLWDGYLATLWYVKSKLGAFIDPVVDKLLTYGAFPGLMICTIFDFTEGWPLFLLNAFLVFYLGYAEIKLACMNYKIYTQGDQGGAGKGGKIKYTIECATLLYLAIINMYHETNPYLVNAILLVLLIACIVFARKSIKGYEQRLSRTEVL